MRDEIQEIMDDDSWIDRNGWGKPSHDDRAERIMALIQAKQALKDQLQKIADDRHEAMVYSWDEAVERARPAAIEAILAYIDDDEIETLFKLACGEY